MGCCEEAEETLKQSAIKLQHKETIVQHITADQMFAGIS